MKALKCFLILLFFISSATAQMDTALLKNNISKSVDSMLQLFKDRDWDKYSDFMHPAVIDMIGGKENFTSVIGTQMEQMGTDAITTKSGAILQLIKTNNGYQCITETFMLMNISGVTLVGSSYDIGTSADGVKWYFTRIPENGADGVKQIIKDLGAELKLPKTQMVPGTTLEEFLKTYTIQYL